MFNPLGLALQAARVKSDADALVLFVGHASVSLLCVVTCGGLLCLLAFTPHHYAVGA